jgi:SAM-dependent methyltransferase
MHPPDGFGAATYGDGFAEVYDRWYPADEATDAAVARISTLAGPGGRVLELGVGTGRLAVPLAAAGHVVVGLDASASMLGRLAANADHLGPAAPTGLLVDLASEDPWPAGPFDVVVAAFNLICNVVDPLAQARVFDRAAQALAPGGHLVVETFVTESPERRERHLELREVHADGVVLIASDTDPAAGIVTGSHIELRDGELPRVRPWRLRLTSPEELDRWATEAGFALDAVHADWNGTDAGAGRVAYYLRG